MLFPSYSTVAIPASAVGSYDITASLSDPDHKLGNYTQTLNKGILTVNAAPLTVTPANASREYGDANPSFTGTITGIKNGDGITASYSSVAIPASAVGSYDITATLSDRSEERRVGTQTRNKGMLTENAAHFTVTPANARREYA